jgi:hypothetical protein
MIGFVKVPVLTGALRLLLFTAHLLPLMQTPARIDAPSTDYEACRTASIGR